MEFFCSVLHTNDVDIVQFVDAGTLFIFPPCAPQHPISISNFSVAAVVVVLCFIV